MRPSRRYRQLQQRRRRRRGLAVLLLTFVLLPLALWQWPQLILNAEFARQRLLAGASSEALQVGEQRWNYLEAGEGPLLLLIHGFTGSKENWLPLMAALGEHYRVIAPDLPGWGESARMAGADYGFAAQSARLDAFVAALAGDQPLHLVGHSMGGGIAALWASTRPGNLRKLVLMDAAGVPFENDFARLVRAGEHPFEVLDEAGLARQMALVFDQAPWIPWPANVALVRQRRAQVDFEREVLQRIAGSETTAYAPGEAARKITAATLLLWCKRDRIIDVSAAEVYAQRIPSARIQLLDNCNHMPMMEQPGTTAAALQSFLASP